MTELLIVAHQPSPNTVAITNALIAGALAAEDVNTICKTPFATEAKDIEDCDGILLFTTENFGYMSGAQKDLFDRVYYKVLDIKRGLPYALLIRAGKDGTGACRSIESIALGLGWSLALAPNVLKGEFDHDFINQAQEFAQTFAAGLSCGIY